MTFTTFGKEIFKQVEIEDGAHCHYLRTESPAVVKRRPNSELGFRSNRDLDMQSLDSFKQSIKNKVDQ